MRDALSAATARAGRRVDAAAALLVGAVGAAEIAGDHGQTGAMKAGVAAALVAGCVAIALCRRHPLGAAVVAGTVWFVPGVIIGPRWEYAAPAAFGFAFVGFAYMVGAHERGGRSVAGVVAAMLGFSLGDFSDLAPMFVFLLPAWFAGEAMRSRGRIAAQLEARARELQAERETFARESVRFERARIARELHDIVAHSVSMMVVQAGAGQRQLAAHPVRAAESLDHINQAARQAEVELGRLLELLADDDVAPAPGGLVLIDQLVARAGATGLEITCRFTGAHDALPLELSDTVYRIAQEGMTNALKHAAGAPVEITVDAGPSVTTVTIVNGPPRGPGSDLPTTGGQRGIAGMRERTRDRGGELEAGPTADGGWRVVAQLPRAVTARS